MVFYFEIQEKNQIKVEVSNDFTDKKIMLTCFVIVKTWRKLEKSSSNVIIIQPLGSVWEKG